jgi:hypothetical protein
MQNLFHYSTIGQKIFHNNFSELQSRKILRVHAGIVLYEKSEKRVPYSGIPEYGHAGYFHGTRNIGCLPDRENSMKMERYFPGRPISSI